MRAKNKIWLLQLIHRAGEWDIVEGFVAVAPTEKEARRQASCLPGDEGVLAWLDAKLSSCKPVVLSAAPGIVLRAYKSA